MLPPPSFAFCWVVSREYLIRGSGEAQDCTGRCRRRAAVWEGQGSRAPVPTLPRGPRIPDLARLAAQARRALGALWCPALLLRRCSRPEPARPTEGVIAKSSAPPGAASTAPSTPGYPGTLRAPRTRPRGALQSFDFFNKTVRLTGRSPGAGLSRGRPRGRRLLPLAEAATQHGRGDRRALTPAAPRVPSGGVPASPHLVAPQRLSSAAPTAICVWRKGSLFLRSLFRTQTSSAAPGTAPSLRKPGRCPRVRRAWALLVRKPGI